MRREDLDQLWKIENVRRSVAMLPASAPVHAGAVSRNLRSF
jgi:hypothetical protein